MLLEHLGCFSPLNYHTCIWRTMVSHKGHATQSNYMIYWYLIQFQYCAFLPYNCSKCHMNFFVLLCLPPPLPHQSIATSFSQGKGLYQNLLFSMMSSVSIIYDIIIIFIIITTLKQFSAWVSYGLPTSKA